jgi:hypothetical protein
VRVRLEEWGRWRKVAAQFGQSYHFLFDDVQFPLKGGYMPDTHPKRDQAIENAPDVGNLTLEIDLAPLLELAYLSPLLTKLMSGARIDPRVACACHCGSESGSGGG